MSFTIKDRRAFLAGALALLVAVNTFATDMSIEPQRNAEQNQQIRDLIEQSEELTLNGELERAKGKTAEALALARENKDSDLLAEALQNSAFVYETEGNFVVARKLYRELLANHQDSLDRLALAGVYSALGACNGQLSDNDRAAELYFEALKIYEEIGEARGVTYTLNNIAVIYDNMDNREKELEYYNKALDTARRNQFKLGEALALSNIGAVYVDDKEFDTALQYLEPALLIVETIQDDPLLIYILNELVSVHIQKREYAEAGELVDRSLALAREKGFGKDEFKSLMLKAEVLAARGQYRQAFAIADQCDELIGKLELLVEKDEPILLRSKIYAFQGNYRKAYELLRQYLELELAAIEAETEEMIHDIQARYDTQLKESEIELLSQEKEMMNLEIDSQRSSLFFLVAGLVLSILLVVIAVWAYRGKASANRQIEEKNAALSAAYDEMEKLAKTDPLTGLINRRAFYEIVNYEQHRQLRSGEVHSFVLADIDHFKKINDSLGHETGDEVLMWVSSQLKGLIRKQDVVCRWGGEEFILFLPNTRDGGAGRLAEKIRSNLEHSAFGSNGNSLRVTMTLGVAEWMPGDLPRHAINQADEALYAGKTDGRNCVRHSRQKGFDSAGDLSL